MDFVNVAGGIQSRVFYNWMDCPYSDNCPGREAREATLIKHRCAFNPSIFECEFYKRFDAEKKFVDFEKVYSLDCL